MVLRPLFQAYRYMEESLGMVGFCMKRFRDWLWSMKAPRSAAMSIRSASGVPRLCGITSAGLRGWRRFLGRSRRFASGRLAFLRSRDLAVGGRALGRC